MKLKLVALMSVLGFVSSTAFAADAQYQSTHKPKMKHHMMAHDYKGSDYKGVLPVVEACPRNDWYQPIMDSMSQSMGRAVPTVDCYKPISLSGGINFDGHFGNLSQGYMGENNENLSLNDAYLNAHANVNDWVKAFASLSYNNASGSSLDADNGSSTGVRFYILPGEYSSASPNDTLTLEQGYITFADFDMSPIFVQLGKQFQDYGRYEIHPITRTMTQVLTETLRTSAEVGFITRMGFNGALYAFNDPLRKESNTHSQYEYGVSLGFDQPSDQLGYDLGIGYLTNMTGVNDVAFSVNAFRTLQGSPTGIYTNTVGSIALYGDVNSGPFSLGARYTTALQRFNAADMLNKNDGSQGAKPWAADIKAGYGFNAWSKNQNVYLGYQTGNDLVYMSLPSSRWLAGYNVDMWRNTNLGLEVAHDVAYSLTDGGTGNNTNTVGLRAAVKFG